MTRIRRTSWLLLSTRSWRQHADAPANRARLCSGRWTVPLQAELFIVSRCCTLRETQFFTSATCRLSSSPLERRCFRSQWLAGLLKLNWIPSSNQAWGARSRTAARYCELRSGPPRSRSLPVEGLSCPRTRTSRERTANHRRAYGRARIFSHASYSRAAWTRIHGRGQRESDGGIRRERDVRPYLFFRADPFASPISVWMMADNPYLPIIGVVGDVSEGSVRAAPQPTVFYSHGRMPWSTMTLFVRGRQPESFVRPVTAALHELDPTLVVSNVRTMEGALAESLAREHISALISTSFRRRGPAAGGARTPTACSPISSLNGRRTSASASRSARLARITGSVVAGGLALVAIGVAGSLLLLRSLGTLLFGVTPYNVPTYTMRRRAAGRHRRARVLPARALRRAHRAANGAPTGIERRQRGSRRPQRVGGTGGGGRQRPTA